MLLRHDSKSLECQKLCDFDGRNNDDDEPLLPDDVNLFDQFSGDPDWEVYGCLWRECDGDDSEVYELARKIKVVDSKLLFDIWHYAPSESYYSIVNKCVIREHYIVHENITIDEIMDIYREKNMIEYHIEQIWQELQDGAYYDIINLNKMIVRQ